MTETQKYRAFATALAKRIGVDATCIRITNRRGHAQASRRTFTVPIWAMKAHPAYRDYYIIHEALHCKGYSHGPRMRATESEHIEKLHNARLQYFGKMYPQCVLCLNTHTELWSRERQWPQLLKKKMLVNETPVVVIS